MTHSQTQGAEGAGIKAEDVGPCAAWATYNLARYGDPDPSHLWEEHLGEDQKAVWRQVYRAALASPAPAEGAGTKTAAAAWLLKRLEAARSDSEAHPEGHSNRTFYAGQAIAYENVLSFLEDEKATPAPAATPGVPDSVRALSEAASEGWDTNDATPYILGPPIDGEIDRFEVIARGPHGHAKSGDAIRKWQANRMFAVAAVNFVRTLISAHPAGQSEQPILRATVDVFANRTDTRLSFGDRTQPEPGVKAVQQAIAALTAEYEARGGCPVVGRHPAGQSTDDGTDRCEVCNKPLIAGQRVMQDVELGTVHAACCGPEREAYVKDVETGEPLRPNDPIPQGYVYEGEDPAGQERPDRKWVCNGDPAEPAGDAGANPDCTFDNCISLKECQRPENCDGLRFASRPIKAAPDSTRTGAAETELTERDIEAPIYEAFARYVGNADERASDFRMFATGYHAALAARPEAPSDAGYQDRAEKWLAAVTEGDPTDLAERRDRFSEEAMELVQSLGATREGMHELVDYVFSRPVGEPGDEMGDTKLCMANLASWAKLDMDACGEAMLARRSKPESVAKIRRKRSTRHGRGPLPGITPPSDPVPSGQAEG